MQHCPGVCELRIFQDIRRGALAENHCTAEERQRHEHKFSDVVPHQNYSRAEIEIGTIVRVDCQT